jgi:L,D-peptidoglycan transpeptidase YkuD (ErfK/YbiS/YcfS/YnhG family)
MQQFRSLSVHVFAISKRARRGHVRLGQNVWPCALGRGGQSVRKREGDGATPIGHWPLKRVYFRADRMIRPITQLPVTRLRFVDGWCDAPGDRNYNRAVRHPYPASAERLWRDDDVYDVIVVLSHNDRPRVRGAGSAIFMHVARPGYQPTEGCIALTKPHLLQLVRLLTPSASVCI